MVLIWEVIGMKYCVEVCLMQYGYVHVDAESKADAENLARELYEKRMVDWADEEIKQLNVDKEN